MTSKDADFYLWVHDYESWLVLNSAVMPKRPGLSKSELDSQSATLVHSRNMR